MFQKFWQFLAALGINFIPAGGFFFGGWSAGTTLGVYWFENVAASLLIALRIVLHRRLAPRQGHIHYEPRQGTSKGNGSLLAYFLPISLIFSFAHGIFLAAIFLVLTARGHGAEVELNGRELLQGCELMLAVLATNFLIDLWSLRQRPFAWIECLTAVNLSRVLLVHVTIVFGLAAAAFTGMNKAFFGLFIGLKTLSDLAGLFPRWNPAVPPAWLCRVMDKLPKAKAGETFAEYFSRDQVEELARRARNEKPA